MNNSVGTTQSGLEFSPKDALATLNAIRRKLKDREYVYHSLLSFAARNFGRQPFKATDLRQAIGYDSSDLLGPEQRQRVTDALPMLCTNPEFTRFVEIEPSTWGTGKRVSIYTVTADAIAFYSDTRATRPVPFGITTPAVEQEVIPVTFVTPTAVVGNNSGSDDTLTLDEAIDLIKRLYARNREYEQTVSTLFTKVQELEAQVSTQKTSVKIDASLREIIRST